jgi:hypothetical protein
MIIKTEQKVFTKVIKNVKQVCLGEGTKRSIKRGGGMQAAKVRIAEFI